VSAVSDAVEAVGRGELVVVPTDTVYGLACTPYREPPVRALSRLKGRADDQPIALVAASVDWLLECVPELRGRAALTARAVLPGLYTLVLPNPARRYPWLGGTRTDTIGVRVPEADGVAAEFLHKVGVVAATSANLHGHVDPRRPAEVPPEIRDAVAVVLDGGELPGTPSTVVDLAGREPVILREGAVPAEEALARIRSAQPE
jgi:L-threonylcarbamoyladenylate synthase